MIRSIVIGGFSIMMLTCCDSNGGCVDVDGNHTLTARLVRNRTGSYPEGTIVYTEKNIKEYDATTHRLTFTGNLQMLDSLSSFLGAAIVNIELDEKPFCEVVLTSIFDSKVYEQPTLWYCPTETSIYKAAYYQLDAAYPDYYATESSLRSFSYIDNWLRRFISDKN